MKIIRIKDYYGNYQMVPVDDQFFEEWCKMRKEDYNQKRRTNYHCLSFEESVLQALYDDPCKDPTFEQLSRLDEIIRMYDAIKMLTPIQRKRIYMFLEGMSYIDIARTEGRDISVIHRSITKALLHLRQLMGE